LIRGLVEGTTVQKVLEKELGAGEVKTVFVNNVSRSFDHVLADGDRVGLFLPVAGGLGDTLATCPKSQGAQGLGPQNRFPLSQGAVEGGQQPLLILWQRPRQG
jgi:hypothetical protein